MTLETKRTIPAPPIHPLAALSTIALDGVLGIFEILDPLMLLFISTGIGFVGFLATLFIQRYISKDEWGVAVAKGLAMGIFAGVPYPIMGTIIGAPLLVWSGLHQWMKPAGTNNQIVDGYIKNDHRLEAGKEDSNES